jgi:ribosomal-protein-alanine N-acetyltransferase
MAPTHPPRPTLEAPGLRLRPPTLADVDAITVAVQDPEIPRWIPVIPDPYTREDAIAFVTRMSDPGWESGQARQWAVFDARTDAVLGMVGLHERLDRVSEVGFWVRRDARGRGVATAAVNAVCAYAFDKLGLARVEWQAIVGNEASRAVARRAGFRFEGVLRGRLDSRGVMSDTWIAARLATDDPDTWPDDHPPTLEEGDLVLRAWRTSDAAEVLAMAADPQMRRYSSVGEVGDLEQARAWIRSRQAPGRLDWAVCDRDTDALLGRVGLMGLLADENSAEVGYWTAPSARGQGLATRAVEVATQHAFGALSRHRLEIRHVPGNAASCAVADRAGYLLEGIQRQAHHHEDEGFEDLELHARLATDPAPRASTSVTPQSPPWI